MKSQAGIVLAILGGFIVGFILSEAILRLTFVWFGSAFGVSFLPLLLPLAGAWFAYRLVRRKS